jgi:hypothetical protein
MKTFWNLLKSSIYNPDFYRGMKERYFGTSLGYFFTLILFLSIIVTIALSVQFIPPTMSFLNNLGTRVLNYYPNDLVITAKDGQISTNAQEPYALPLPDELKNSNMPGNPENLLVIDTKNSASIDLFKQYKTAVWLTKTDVVYYDKDAVRIQPLDKLPNGQLEKSTVVKGVDIANRIFKFVPTVMVIAMFVGAFVIRSFELIYLLFAALIVWLIFMMRKTGGDYKTAYQVSLHAVTLSMIVSTLFILFGLPLVPFMSTILLTIIAVINIKGPAGESATSG